VCWPLFQIEPVPPRVLYLNETPPDPFETNAGGTGWQGKLMHEYAQQAGGVPLWLGEFGKRSRRAAVRLGPRRDWERGWYEGVRAGGLRRKCCHAAALPRCWAHFYCWFGDATSVIPTAAPAPVLTPCRIV
jgi:hypothetical protein